MDEVVWRLVGAKRAHDTSAMGSDLGEGPLGLASRAPRLEDYKIRMFGKSEDRKFIRFGRSEFIRFGRIGDCGI